MSRISFRVGAALAVSLLAATRVVAQEPTLPELDDLKAPTSPAFVILDAAPSRVERPQAVKPLVLSAISASGEGFPKNYAVEFSPYWLGTPQLTFNDYYGNDVLKNSVRHLSLSVATTPLAKAPELGTALALGVRTLPVPGRAHPSLPGLQKKLVPQLRSSLDLQSILNRRAQLIKLLREALAMSLRDDEEILSMSAPFSTLVDQALQAYIKEIETTKTLIAGLTNELNDKQNPLSDRERQQREAEIEEQEKRLQQAEAESGVKEAMQMLEAFRTSPLPVRISVEQTLSALATRLDEQFAAALQRSEAQLKATSLKIQALDSQRVGFMLAVAGAIAWDVPGDITSEAKLSRLGLWVTPGYRIIRCNPAKGECSRPLDFLAVLRYLDDRRAARDPSWELGARFVWQAADKLSLSAEWLGRTSGDDSSDRAVGVAEYEINKSAFLYASFGRDFEEAGTRRNLVSVIGITFGFGKKPIVTASE